ncbi:alpha/beta hydrolase [Streptomyces tremellae]|uniref:Alpha/beta hydrolase n=1 Tax=Streptomyces tremellae TaxID=1124239 RepID=A0ABP7FDT3_9ACTN
MAEPPPEPVLVLVHGAHHDGGCWDPVVRLLARRGVRAHAVDLPLTSYDDDTAAVREAVRGAAAGGRTVVLVAHSYGGLPVSAGGHGADRLVYVAARMPLPGRSPAGLTPRWGHPAYRAACEVRADGAVVLRPEARDVLYSASPAALADAAAGRWRPMWSAVPAEPLADPAWLRRPTLYVVCARDRTVRVDAQRACAAEATESAELDCDHAPFLSAPGPLAALLAGQAARAVGA